MPSGDGGKETRFKKGNPGGPGSPHIKRLAHFTNLFNKCAMEEVTEPVMRRWIKAAIKKIDEGDFEMFKEMVTRLIGPPKQDIEVSGPEGGPIQLDLTQATDDDLRTLREALLVQQ